MAGFDCSILERDLKIAREMLPRQSMKASKQHGPVFSASASGSGGHPDINVHVCMFHLSAPGKD